MDHEYYTAGEKEFLLKIALKSLEKSLQSGEKFEPQTINKKLWEKRGVFVTLSLNGKLRGCVGNVEASESLIIAIRNNVLLAINDSRFEPLNIRELDLIEIEISILSDLIKTSVDNIKIGDGILVKRGDQSATYLPSVWKSLKDKDIFLGSLCEKAGLNKDAGDDPKTDFWVYHVTAFQSNKIS